MNIERKDVDYLNTWSKVNAAAKPGGNSYAENVMRKINRAIAMEEIESCSVAHGGTRPDWRTDHISTSGMNSVY